jgi:hypothetical protein
MHGHTKALGDAGIVWPCHALDWKRQRHGGAASAEV